METRTIAQRLALAEGHVQHGDTQVKRQRALLRHLERHGLGTFHARRQLKELENSQASFLEYRDQLKSEMALSAVSPAGPRMEVPVSSAGVGVFLTAQASAPKA
jgi:hypothetical protein